MSRSAAADLLRAAARRIAAGAWCQHAIAQRADGDLCSPLDLDAARWCAAGAIQREAGSRIHPALAEALNAAEWYLTDLLGETAISPGVISRFNDAAERQANEVAAMLRAAADRLTGGAS